MTPGLTAAQVAQRREQGLANVVTRSQTRSFTDILRANVFTRFNAIIGVLLAVVLVFGPIQDALFGLVIVVNSAVGIIQEVRAKRKLEALALLERSPVRVRRDGRTQEVAPDDVVVDDVILLSAGDKVPVDGAVIESAGLELDESLLTGEADPVPKQEGDAVRSGSFVVAGSGSFVAQHVGDHAYANRLVADVRRFELANSELMTGINRILRAITWVIVPLGVLVIISQLASAGSLPDAMVRTVAGIVPMIPEGLVLMTSVAFAVGVVRLAQRRCLVQELPAIETLARVDVLCLDKTGTLTAPEMDLDEIVVAPGADEQRVRAALAGLARIEDPPNATARAIADALPETPGWRVTATVPFSSARKFSAASFTTSTKRKRRGTTSTWCIGGADVVLPDGDPLRARADELAAQGLRVLALSEVSTLPGERIEGQARPAALVVLRQRLRPEAAETMRYLADEGVDLKIISGDHAVSVSAVAESVGIKGKAVDARTLPVDDPAGLAAAMRDYTVFGRVTPEQKRGFVDGLKANGYTVGMTGDGVNDALALKNADLGIAMGSGSAATRGVAKIVLLDNNFGTMPRVLAEGRRVLGNIERVASLFLVKTSYSLVLALLVSVAHVPFPLLPRHVTLVGSLTIGIPGFFLALAPNTERFRPGFVSRVLGRAAPAGLVCGISAFTAYGLARLNEGSNQFQDSSTAALTLFLSAAWMLALVARPYTWWRAALVAAMVGAFVLVAAVPFGREFFALDFSDHANNLIGLVTAAAAAVVITVIHQMDGGGHVVAWLHARAAAIARFSQPLRDKARAAIRGFVRPARDDGPTTAGSSAAPGSRASVDMVGYESWEAIMSSTDPSAPSAEPSTPAARRAGYLIAAAVTVFVWFAVFVWPGWRSFGFITEDFHGESIAANILMLVTIVAYVLYAIVDSPRLRVIGGVLTSAFGVAVLVAILVSFPFSFASGSAWPALMRAGLVFAIVGAAADILLQARTFRRTVRPAAVGSTGERQESGDPRETAR